MAMTKRSDNWPPRVRQVVDLVSNLLGLKPWYSNARPGGRFTKWRLPTDRNWTGIAQEVEALLRERGVWEDGCVEVVVKTKPSFIRITAYQDPQPRLQEAHPGLPRGPTQPEMRAAFLAAVCAAPDDDAPRLIYADWLEEQGDSHRAELIRAQIELATLEADDSDSQAVFAFLQRHDRKVFSEFDWEPVDPGVARRAALKARAETLAKRHRQPWKAAEAPGRCGVAWGNMERGFFAAGTLQWANAFTRSAGDLFQRAPLRRLEVPNLSPAQAHAFVESGVLARLNSLVLWGTAEIIRILGASPDAAHIRELTLRRRYDANRVAQAIASSNHWRGLRVLDLRHSGSLSAGAAEELFRSPHLRGLTRLRVWGSRWPAQTVRTLAEGRFTALRELQLFQCGLGDEAAQVLASCPSLQRLRTLELPTSRITGTGVSALLASPYLKKLAVLDLSQNSVRQLDPVLLGGAQASSLRVLDLTSWRKSGADVATLAGCPALRGLIWLNLESNKLNDQAVQALSRTTGLPRLAVLNLLYCHIGDRGAVALANWSELAGVRCLHLNGNDFGPDGARALAASPHLPEVRHLCIDAQKIGVNGLAALRRRFGRAVKAL
jgi:uncharacterized protein (TIGR02996 family)